MRQQLLSIKEKTARTLCTKYTESVPAVLSVPSATAHATECAEFTEKGGLSPQRGLRRTLGKQNCFF